MVKKTFRRKKSGKRRTTRKYKSKHTHRRKMIRGGGRILPGFNRLNHALKRGIFDAFRNNPRYTNTFMGKTDAQMLDLVYEIISIGRVNHGGVAIPQTLEKSREINYIEENGNSVPTTLTVSGNKLKVQVWQPRTPRHRWSNATVYEYSPHPPLDYQAMFKEHLPEFQEELLARSLHPDRIDRLVEQGYTQREIVDNL